MVQIVQTRATKRESDLKKRKKMLRVDHAGRKVCHTLSIAEIGMRSVNSYSPERTETMHATDWKVGLTRDTVWLNNKQEMQC